MTITIYGIKNCDTMKKARTWLNAREVEYQFHDYKLQGIDRSRLERWCGEFGWEKVINRAGTSFRRLPDVAKASLDAAGAIGLMLEQPSMIKRPVLEVEGRILIGFKPETCEELFSGASLSP